MKLFYECLACYMRQAVEVAEKFAEDETQKKQIIKEAIKILNNFDNYQSSPELARDLHKKINEITKIKDLYYDTKQKDIKAAKSLMPYIKKNLTGSKNYLKDILKISAIGNNIDSAVYFGYDITANLEKEIQKEFSVCDDDIFKQKLKKAKTIMIFGDNAGESVFDCLLCDFLKDKKIYYVVREQPIINDTTKEEAIQSDLDKYAEIISSGCTAPGLILNECNEEFFKVYKNANLIISKGQGNYEAYSDEKKDVFYILKAKCNMVAKDIDVPLNGYVFKYNKNI